MRFSDEVPAPIKSPAFGTTVFLSSQKESMRGGFLCWAMNLKRRLPENFLQPERIWFSKPH
jgi:hypothetical protein